LKNAIIQIKNDLNTIDVNITNLNENYYNIIINEYIPFVNSVARQYLALYYFDESSQMQKSISQTKSDIELKLNEWEKLNQSPFSEIDLDFNNSISDLVSSKGTNNEKMELIKKLLIHPNNSDSLAKMVDVLASGIPTTVTEIQDLTTQFETMKTIIETKISDEKKNVFDTKLTYDLMENLKNEYRNGNLNGTPNELLGMALSGLENISIVSNIWENTKTHSIADEKEQMVTTLNEIKGLLQTPTSKSIKTLHNSLILMFYNILFELKGYSQKNLTTAASTQKLLFSDLVNGILVPLTDIPDIAINVQEEQLFVLESVKVANYIYGKLKQRLDDSYKVDYFLKAAELHKPGSITKLKTDLFLFLVTLFTSNNAANPLPKRFLACKNSNGIRIMIPWILSPLLEEKILYWNTDLFRDRMTYFQYDDKFPPMPLYFGSMNPTHLSQDVFNVTLPQVIIPSGAQQPNPIVFKDSLLIQEATWDGDWNLY
jgi:hypothetical protein